MAATNQYEAAAKGCSATALVGVHIGPQPGAMFRRYLFRGHVRPPPPARVLSLMRIGANVPPDTAAHLPPQYDELMSERSVDHRRRR